MNVGYNIVYECSCLFCDPCWFANCWIECIDKHIMDKICCLEVCVRLKSMLKSAINMHFFLSFEILPNKSLNCILNVFVYL